MEWLFGPKKDRDSPERQVEREDDRAKAKKEVTRTNRLIVELDRVEAIAKGGQRRGHY